MVKLRVRENAESGYADLCRGEEKELKFEFYERLRYSIGLCDYERVRFVIECRKRMSLAGKVSAQSTEKWLR